MRSQTVPRQLFWRARARVLGVTLLLFLLQTQPVRGEVRLIEAFSNLTFTQPLDLRSSPDNSGRIFVVERTGQIKVFSNDSQTSSATVFLDLTARVKVEVEHGLLSMAFSPEYGTNREFYVTYSEAVTGATRRRPRSIRVARSPSDPMGISISVSGTVVRKEIPRNTRRTSVPFVERS
jgi:hypothetical protein